MSGEFFVVVNPTKKSNRLSKFSKMIRLNISERDDFQTRAPVDKPMRSTTELPTGLTSEKKHSLPQEINEQKAECG